MSGYSEEESQRT